MNARALGLVLGPKGKSPAYYFAGPTKAVDHRAIAWLKARARRAAGGAVRICLHGGPKAFVHDMIIALRRSGPVAVHKHLTREETYHMIEGRLRLRFFDARGAETGSALLGAPGTGLPLVYRVPKNAWHATSPETGTAVFHESRPGPFDAADTLTQKLV